MLRPSPSSRRPAKAHVGPGGRGIGGDAFVQQKGMHIVCVCVCVSIGLNIFILFEVESVKNKAKQLLGKKAQLRIFRAVAASISPACPHDDPAFEVDGAEDTTEAMLPSHN